MQIDDEKESETGVEVDQDRIFKLKAAIVRIMKARKTLSHTDLVQETIGQVNRHSFDFFNCDPNADGSNLRFQ